MCPADEIPPPGLDTILNSAGFGKQLEFTRRQCYQECIQTGAAEHEWQRCDRCVKILSRRSSDHSGVFCVIPVVSAELSRESSPRRVDCASRRYPVSLACCTQGPQPSLPRL
ncbi:hypothetical protein ElyMa_001145400 [Elysia marginata]|uniref:Uncharacterized protein n=1 Tax=Elysia marginata TaxID=1093978 RepID=A0AAV4I1A2_9GAST|nr:hypothetical protein ElyMa_001145400 [Elysia marginata]